MPPTKDFNTRHYNGRPFSNNESTSMSARVYHPATNLIPPTPPLSPTEVTPGYPIRSNGYSWNRQMSQNGGKYS